MASSTELKSKLEELRSIEIETKSKQIELNRLRAELNSVYSRRRQIQAEIANYLEETNQDGIQYKSIVYTISKKEKRDKKSKEDKLFSMAKVLEDYGVDRNKIRHAVNDVFDSMKGDVSGETKSIRMRAPNVADLLNMN